MPSSVVKTQMFDGFEAIKGAINAEKIRVRNTKPLIFLCGGPIAQKEDAKGCSVRDLVYTKICEEHSHLLERIILAEKIFEWQQHIIRAGYAPDLLTFEKHLSSLSSVICIISESPGSIAELGCFTVMDIVSDRVMVAIAEEHHINPSFISLGPLKHLDQKQPQKTRIFAYPWVYKWSAQRESSIPILNNENLTSEIVEDLLDFDSSSDKTSAFDSRLGGHVSLLACDLIDLFSALKLRDVYEILKSNRINIQYNDLKFFLMTMEEIGFIKTRSYRGAEYYLPKGDCRFIDYNFPRGERARFDRERFKMQQALFYKENDKKRANVIASDL